MEEIKGGGGSSVGRGGKKKLLKANVETGDIAQTLEFHRSRRTVSVRVAR